jgi:D-inositol-3-phosphate glycosyltransferase
MRFRMAMLSVHSCPLGNLGTKDTGGMSIYVREMAREMGKLGVTVDVYTKTHDSGHTPLVDLGQNARLIHLKAGEDENLRKLDVYPYLPDFAREVEDFRQRHDLDYDLIFSHYWLSGLAGNSLAQRWAVPHIMMFHTLGLIKNAIGVGASEPPLRIEAEGYLANHCRHIIATTEGEKQQLAQHYGTPAERISVIPCGVNLDLFQPVDRETARRKLGLNGNKTVLYVGRIEPLKGLSQLVKAMAQLPNRNGTRLLIIGGDEQSRCEIEHLRKLARRLKLADAVTFWGIVDHERLPFFYSAADVCVIPSYYESFGLVALESIACGTPVVTTSVGNLKSIIQPGENGYVVPDNDPRHLADKIALVLSRPVAETGSAPAIRQSVAKFSWANVARAVIKDCQGLLGSPVLPLKLPGQS